MQPSLKAGALSIKLPYRPEIDGLRALAVIAVIINHLNKESQQTPVTPAARKARRCTDDIRTREKMVILDLFDTYCPGSQFTFNAAGGETLYRDEYAHPSIESARLSAPIIREVLKPS